MTKKLSKYVAIYKAQLEIGDIQIAYEQLVKFTMMVKARFEEASPLSILAGMSRPVTWILPTFLFLMRFCVTRNFATASC